MNPVLRFGNLYPHRDGDLTCSACQSDDPDVVGEQTAHAYVELLCGRALFEPRYRARGSSCWVRWCYPWIGARYQLSISKMETPDGDLEDQSGRADDDTLIDSLALL